MDLDNFLNKPILRQLREAVATIRAMAYVIGGLLALVALLVIFYVSYGRDHVRPDLAITIGICVLAVLAVVSAFGYYIREIDDPDYYEILELDGLLIVEPIGDHHRYTYTRRQRVRSNRDDLRLIEIHAHWTGTSSKGKLHADSLIADQVLLDGRRKEEDGYVRRWIYPRRPIHKGREVEVGVRQVHEDDIERQFPYFRESGVRHKTREISVAVRFPINADPRSLGEVKSRKWNSNLPRRQNQPEDYKEPTRRLRDDGTVEYKLLVKNPKRYHSYGIEWTWPNSEDE